MSKNAKPILEVKNLVKKFGDFTAVDGISFEIKEGEILGFLGPNGAGKTTTIYSILGLIEKDGGDVRIFGKDLGKNRSEVLEKVNYSSAEFNLIWNLSVWENLVVYSKLYGVSDYKVRIKELLDIFEISDLKNKLIRNLSFGQRTRSSLCKAFINRPKLLLLDEPMASLDPDVVDKGIELIKRIQEEEKMSVLYTSHNMWEIEEVADQVIFINHGKVVAQGTPLELTRQEMGLEAKEPNLREVFIKISRRGNELS